MITCFHPHPPGRMNPRYIIGQKGSVCESGRLRDASSQSSSHTSDPDPSLLFESESESPLVVGTGALMPRLGSSSPPDVSSALAAGTTGHFGFLTLVAGTRRRRESSLWDMFFIWFTRSGWIFHLRVDQRKLGYVQPLGETNILSCTHWHIINNWMGLLDPLLQACYIKSWHFGYYMLTVIVWIFQSEYRALLWPLQGCLSWTFQGSH